MNRRSSAVGSAGTTLDAVRLAIGTFTVIRVRPPSRVDVRIAERALALSPLIGACLGAIATLGAWGMERATGSTLVAAVVAVAALAALTRGLHLDGLADVADGLGSGRSGPSGVEVMRRSDIGPFGIVTLVLVLLGDIALIAHLVEAQFWVAVPIAAALGRLGAVAACSGRVPAATATGLGAAVSGSVRALALTLVVIMTAALATLAGYAGLIALIVSMAAALFVVRRCTQRFGGITGDVLGAVIEVGTLVALATLAVLA